MNAPESVPPGLSEDRYFGGRLTLRQPLDGLRAGDDALLLAAAVPAKTGERVFEAGIGTGAAALALLSRVTATNVVGVEIDAGHASLARDNARLNRLDSRLQVIEADLAAATAAFLRGRDVEVPFGHAFANPPFHSAGRVRAPRAASRERAHVAAPASLEMWIARLADLVTGGGSVTVIHLAMSLGPLIAAFEARLGGIVVLPLAPKAGGDATRVIVRARKGSRAPLRLMAPLVLHGAGGDYTSSAEAVLREGAGLDLD